MSAPRLVEEGGSTPQWSCQGLRKVCSLLGSIHPFGVLDHGGAGDCPVGGRPCISAPVLQIWCCLLDSGRSGICSLQVPTVCCPVPGARKGAGYGGE